ncbi:thioesterase II family protein [Kitasatospora viridis]|uniref:Surfactin synthase thioesterase subunit n=1 Tax=Kitasatospora viridis TaxID=281105 RepID=A0A561UC10_9ACTN|nr:thioesterase domain-containing protein [Kitasatospora viridis]TWF96895.1 surfactin synthase thioesterase subunit [Kitasatospora viridis]
MSEARTADRPVGANRVNGRWLLRFQPRPAARVRLLCLPGAGAAAAMYRDWGTRLPARVEVCAVQLPGRGARLREQPYTEFEPLVDALAAAVLAEPALPTVLFGHSLGSVIGYELADRLRDSGPHAPLALVAAGHQAPWRGSAGLPYHQLPDEELAQVLVALGGTPEAVLAKPELLRLALPALRADFALDYGYRHRRRPALAIPVTVYGGLDDPTVDEAGLAAWHQHTGAGFRLRMLPGGHFFPAEPAGAELLAELGAELARLG